MGGARRRLAQKSNDLQVEINARLERAWRKGNIGRKRSMQTIPSGRRSLPEATQAQEAAEKR